MLSEFGEVFENANLENYNTYRIKTYADYLVKPRNAENVQKLIQYLENNNIKYYVLGGGSNIILPDTKFNGVIISLEDLKTVEIDKTKVRVDAGINLGALALLCIKNSLKGFEYLAGIPGSLGGALYGNAGVSNHTIYDYLESITILKDNELITLKKEDITYSYRDTCFKHMNVIILSATFNLYYDDEEKLMEIVKENRMKRLNSQPLEYPNAGSVFKNPKNDYAGRLIESLGLKGYTINGAKVSEKHANFIVNTGNAKGEDIKALIKYIQDEVFKAYKIELELEQIIVKWE